MIHNVRFSLERAKERPGRADLCDVEVMKFVNRLGASPLMAQRVQL